MCEHAIHVITVDNEVPIVCEDKDALQSGDKATFTEVVRRGRKRNPLALPPT